MLKLGIELEKKTIWNILHDFRRKGKVKRDVTWAQFLKSHIKSIIIQKDRIKVLSREYRKIILLEILEELNLNQHYLD